MVVKVNYVCNSCGYESSKWYGRCPTCQNWNTFAEFRQEDKKTSRKLELRDVRFEKASEIKTSFKTRLSTGFEEFDRVLGGGIVPGSVVLLSGDPGIGKSTLLLQVALNVAGFSTVSHGDRLSPALKNRRNTPKNLTSRLNSPELRLDPRLTGQAQNRTDNKSSRNVFYITGEESTDQVRMRMARIINDKELIEKELFVISATNVDAITALLNKENPSLVIIDSIQTMESSDFPGFPGSMPQIRNATSSFISYAKKNGIPVFLVGHVTKEGIVAGPMLLSHMVDAVIYLEGEKLSETRIIRAFKNRFGDASEVGIFVMREKGLVEIKDASNYFVHENKPIPGSCVAVIMEGTRPILVEIQALVVSSNLSFPRRVINGLPDRRVELLLAVLQKHVKIPVDRMDVFVNIVGGIKVLENASDLAVCLAVISSFKNKSLHSFAAVSEVGLLGELRNVMNLDKRVIEAKKFGFKNVLTPKEYKSLNEVVYKLWQNNQN